MAEEKPQEAPSKKPKEEVKEDSKDQPSEGKPAEESKEEAPKERRPKERRGKKPARQQVEHRASAAEVVEIIGRVGGKHASMQVRCKVLEGRDSGRIIRRNVIGPIRTGDVLLLTQTEIEASPLKGGRR